MKGHILIDNRYSDVARAAWGDEYEIIPSVSADELPLPVCAHPDMALFQTGQREYICAPNVYAEYEKLLKKYNIKLICGKAEIKCNYPEDIAYNVFKTDKFALGLFSYVDKKIIQYLDKENIEKIDIRQGYAKCSTLGTRGGIISADDGICTLLEKKGVDVLKIPAGEIKLPGYDYGFIGGASGQNKDGEVFFFGDLKSVSFGGKILNFLNEKGIKARQIDGYPLTDVGTIMFF